MNHHLMHSDQLDADADDLAPLDEIEYEESETPVEVGLLVAQIQATRFLDA